MALAVNIYGYIFVTASDPVRNSLGKKNSKSILSLTYGSDR
jgi:hypothetical protein